MRKNVSPGNFDLTQLNKRFPDEESCVKYLFQIRWPEGFFCPKCGKPEHIYYSIRQVYICKSCGYQASVTAGTIFHNSRTPLQIWFKVIYLMCRQRLGIAALTLQKILHMPSYQTIWHICHKIRAAMNNSSCYNSFSIIELDRNFFNFSKRCKKPAKAGRKTMLAIFLHDGGIGEKSEKNINMFVLQKSAKAALNIEKALKLHPQTLTEFSNSQNPKNNQYSLDYPLNNELLDIAKSILNKNEDQLPDPEVFISELLKSKTRIKIQDRELKNIETQGAVLPNLIKYAKTLVKDVRAMIDAIYHGIGRKNLQQFINDYCFRFNLKNTKTAIFDKLLTSCVNTKSLTYFELTG